MRSRTSEYSAIATLLALSVVLAVPLLLVVLSSFTRDIYAGVPSFSTLSLTLENYRRVVNAGIVGAGINSLVISTLAASLSLAIALLVIVLALPRPAFGVRALVSVASWRVLPPAIIVLPQVYFLKQGDVSNPAISMAVLIGLQMIPLAILLMCPAAIRAHNIHYDHSLIDGATYALYVQRVLLPQLTTMIGFVLVILVLVAWTELFIPSLFLTSREGWTLPMFLSQYITGYNVLWGELYACASVMILLGFASTVGLTILLRRLQRT